MTQNASKSWIVAYDIREPRRLRRVHRYLRKTGVSAQYSMFVVQANDRGIDRVMDDVSSIVAGVDDVRAYHVPERCEVWSLGAQALPEGVYLDPVSVARLVGSVVDGQRERGLREDDSKVGWKEE